MPPLKFELIMEWSIGFKFKLSLLTLLVTHGGVPVATWQNNQATLNAATAPTSSHIHRKCPQGLS